MKVLFLRMNTIIICAITLIMICVYSIYGMYLEYKIPANAQIKKIPIYNVKTDENVISLTFDSAWDNNDLESIFTTLSEYNIKVTFFIVGDFAKKYPDSVRKMHDMGHDVVNHSSTHAHMSKLTQREIEIELKDCDEIIHKITGENKPLFRPPYGEYNDLVVKTAENKGYYTIQWDVDSLDWKGLNTAEMIERINKKVKSGSIILMHNGAPNTAEALPEIIENLINKGYSFVPVSELIYYDNYTIDNNGTQILNPDASQ